MWRSAVQVCLGLHIAVRQCAPRLKSLGLHIAARHVIQARCPSIDTVRSPLSVFPIAFTVLRSDYSLRYPSVISELSPGD